MIHHFWTSFFFNPHFSKYQVVQLQHLTSGFRAPLLTSRFIVAAFYSLIFFKFFLIYFDIWRHLRWTNFHFVPTFCLSFEYCSRDKNINIDVITGLNFFSPWFSIFQIWISWMNEGQKILIPDDKSGKTELDRCLFLE